MNDRDEPTAGKVEAFIHIIAGILLIFCIVALYSWLIGFEPTNIAGAILMGIFYLAIIASVIVTIINDAGHDLNIYARRKYDRKHGKENSDY